MPGGAAVMTGGQGRPPPARTPSNLPGRGLTAIDAKTQSPLMMGDNQAARVLPGGGGRMPGGGAGGGGGGGGGRLHAISLILYGLSFFFTPPAIPPV